MKASLHQLRYMLAFNSAATGEYLRGVALIADSPGNTHVPQPGGAESGALGAREAPSDPELAAVVDAWPTLAEPIRAGILAMVRAAGGAK